MTVEEKYAGGVSGENRRRRLVFKSEWMGRSRSGRYSNANICFQSFFMLITVQPSFASSYKRLRECADFGVWQSRAPDHRHIRAWHHRAARAWT